MKILIITTAFYPEQAIGAVRVSKLVKYLNTAGVDVSVVSKYVTADLPQDTTLHFDGLERINWITAHQSPWFQRLFMNARKKVVKGRSALSLTGKSEARPSLKTRVMRYLQFGFTLLKGHDWTRMVMKEVRAQMPNQTFDVVLASYPSYGAPLAARALVKRGIARKLVIDFRDPMAYGDRVTPGLEVLNRHLQQRFATAADAALFISPGVQMMVSRTSPFALEYVLSNGYDPDDAYDATPVPLNHDKLRFCYVGALYDGKRDLSIFFSELSDLITSGAIPASAVELKYAGKECAILKAQARKHGLEGIIVDLGFVSRQESMDLQQASDICLVSTWNDERDQGILTGKLFEYFLFRKPVIAIVSGTLPNSEMKRVVATAGSGVTVELSSIDLPSELAVLRDFIMQSYDAKRTSGQLQHTYDESVENFGYPNLVAQLRDTLNDVVEG